MENKNDLIKTSIVETGVLQISLNRPEQRNALSYELLSALAHLLDQVKQDKSIKAILLTGEGKAFCAGADIKQLSPLNGASGLRFARFGQDVMRRLELLGKPSIAAIHGFAFGGGCELAMAATMRIATSDAVFGQPEIKLGVIPGFGGTQRLSRLIGKGRALEICLSGRRFSAQEAHHWGFLNEMTSAEDLLTRAKTLLKELAQQSPVAMQGIMTVINQGYDIPLEEGFELEAAHFALCCTTRDKQEGVSAFLEKRAAQFSGE